MPYSRDASGPLIAWLLYRGACIYADKSPHPRAGQLALACSCLWFALFHFGPQGSWYLAAITAEIPLVLGSAVTIWK